MTAIGRALTDRPRLLVLAEPTMCLAPRIAETIFATLGDLNRRKGLSILVAEQNSAVALQNAHRAVVIANGASVLAGAADELRARDDIRAFYRGHTPAPGADDALHSH